MPPINQTDIDQMQKFIEESYRKAKERQSRERRDVKGDYVALENILYEAYQQASAGKGNERHANNRPFDRQPIAANSGNVR